MASAQNRDVDSREKAAVRRENAIVLTSGAKEKVDKTIAGMKGAGHILTHPFSKAAREEANAKTIDEKTKVEIKQANIRATAHQQVILEKEAAAGVHPPQEEGLDVPLGSPRPPPDGVDAPSEVRHGNGGIYPPPQGPDEPLDSNGPESRQENTADPMEASSEQQRGDVEEHGHSGSVPRRSEESFSSSNSDDSTRARAQIPPTSADYRSG